MRPGWAIWSLLSVWRLGKFCKPPQPPASQTPTSCIPNPNPLHPKPQPLAFPTPPPVYLADVVYLDAKTDTYLEEVSSCTPCISHSNSSIPGPKPLHPNTHPPLLFADVVYLDAKTDTYLEEVSSCNIFVRKGKTIKTPPLAGTILPGEGPSAGQGSGHVQKPRVPACWAPVHAAEVPPLRTPAFLARSCA